MKVGTVHRMLAYLAAALAVVCVILAAISRFTGLNLVITSGSYMTLTVVAVLFAIYLLIEGGASSATKAK